MLSVRLHIQGDTVWALCKCSACRNVHKYTVRDAVAGPVTCPRCGHAMDIRGAVIEAVDRMPGAAPSSGGNGGSQQSPRSPTAGKNGEGEGGTGARRRYTIGERVTRSL